MRRVVIGSILAVLFFIGTGKDLSALTFEFNKDKPGVQAFALRYLRFTIEGENIISKLPSTFYVISYSAEDIPVLAARVGKIDKNSGLSSYLGKISGGSNAKSIAGPHGEKILYNPNKPPEKKLLSSYALWEGWIFIGNQKETIQNLLKLYKSPSDIVKADKSISSLKEWKGAGVRVWSDNSDHHLYDLFEAQKKMILIPLIRDPKKIQYMGGAFALTESKELNGSLLIRPVNPQARKDIEGDLKFVGETIRRRLTAVKTPYRGKIYSTGNGVVYETYIGNYMTAQGQVVRVGN